MHNRCYFGFNKYIPVGIPRIFDPRPKPLMTSPPIYHGSIGSAPPIPGIQQYKSMLLSMRQEYHTQSSKALCVCLQHWHTLGSASDECSLQTYDLEKEEIPNFQVQGPTVSLV